MPEPPLDDEEIRLCREMARDYDRAKWLRGQLKWWGIWVLGVPAAVVIFVKSISDLLNLWPKR